MTKAIRAVLLLLLPMSTSSTSMELSGTPSCSGDFTVDSFAMDCGNECTFGSTVTISGSVSSTNGFDSTVGMKVSACVMSMMCFNLLDTSGELCNFLEPSDGQDCSAAGAYSFSTEFTIPGKNGSNWYYGYWVDIKTNFTSADGGTTQCKASIKAVKSSYSTAFFVSFSGIVMFTSLSTLLFKRKRAILVLNDDLETNLPASDFEMKNSVIQGTIV